MPISLSKQDLLSLLPSLNMQASGGASFGGEIPVSIGADMLKDYQGFKITHDLQSQTDNITFTFSDLVKWMTSVESESDELVVCLATDPNNMLTVVLWPYKNGQPAVDSNGDLLKPYNYGHRRP